MTHKLHYFEDYDYKTEPITDISSKDVIDTHKTGVSFYDDLLPGSSENKYMRDAKNLVGKIEKMSPNEYYQECATKIFNNSSVEKLKYQRGVMDKDTTDHLKEVILTQKKKFPTPYINYAEQEQEGLHRLYALGEIFGWDEKFPILVVDWYSEERHQREEENKNRANKERVLKNCIQKALEYRYSEIEEFIDEIRYQLEDFYDKYNIEVTYSIKNDVLIVSCEDIEYEVDIDLIRFKFENDDDIDDEIDWDDLDADDVLKSILGDK